MSSHSNKHIKCTIYKKKPGRGLRGQDQKWLKKGDQESLTANSEKLVLPSPFFFFFFFLHFFFFLQFFFFSLICMYIEFEIWNYISNIPMPTEPDFSYASPARHRPSTHPSSTRRPIIQSRNHGLCAVSQF
jgi:hypothetical protein